MTRSKRFDADYRRALRGLINKRKGKTGPPIARVHLVCDYTPADFFEEALRAGSDGFEIAIAAGRAVAMVPDASYALDPAGIRDRFHQAVERLLLGAQLTQRRPYSLSKASVERVTPTGARQFEVFAESRLTVSMQADVRMVMTDDHGNKTVVDTRLERIARQARFAELTAKHIADATLQSMMGSYAGAVRDPANALIHLYEVSDAMMKHFGGKEAAITKLGLDKKEWSDLGRLASSEPLRQGRHRGQSAGILRDATSEELGRAREIAEHMIEKYLAYLEAQATPRPAAS